MRSRLLHLALLVLLLLQTGGCQSLPAPLDDAEIERYNLAPIRDAYAATVQAAHNDPEHTWHKGLAGNVVVNVFTDSTRGLCWHWQSLVHEGVVDVVQAHGFEMNGIVVDEGTMHEHHALIVYRGTIVATMLDPEHAPYDLVVLDPWPTGRAEIYDYVSWIRVMGDTSVPTRRETVPPLP